MLIVPRGRCAIEDRREEFVPARLTFRPALFTMLNYALIFLIVALLAGVLGFGVIAGTAATIAKVLFVVFLVLFVVSLIKRRS